MRILKCAISCGSVAPAAYLRKFVDVGMARHRAAAFEKNCAKVPFSPKTVWRDRIAQLFQSLGLPRNFLNFRYEFLSAGAGTSEIETASTHLRFLETGPDLLLHVDPRPEDVGILT